MKVNILGTEYTVIRTTEQENPKLEDCNGLCETYSKEIVLCEEKASRMNLNNFESFEKKVVRHEIVHAFFHESGLDEYSHDEKLVDWLALQAPKLFKAFKEVETLE